MEQQKVKRSGCLARLSRISLWLILFIRLILTVGIFYQFQTTAADFEQYPAQGQRVEVGSYSLTIHCTGQGSLRVIVDTDNGDFSLGWQGIQPEERRTYPREMSMYSKGEGT